MKGSNPEQLAADPKFKTIVRHIVDDWNSLHKQQVDAQKSKLTIQRATKMIAKFIEQPAVYNQLVNANITDLRRDE